MDAVSRVLGSGVEMQGFTAVLPFMEQAVLIKSAPRAHSSKMVFIKAASQKCYLYRLERAEKVPLFFEKHGKH
jgi:hypothetical protein